MNTLKRNVNIFCQGNLAAGKSSMLKRHQELFGNKYQYVSEPLEQFEQFECTSKEIMNPLEMFYNSKDQQSQMGGLIQLHIVDTFDKMLSEMDNDQGRVVIWDRSFYDVDVFTDSLNDQNRMCKFAFEYCKKKTQELKDKYQHFKADGIFFLSTTAPVCAERVCSRGRNMELTYGSDKMKVHLTHIENNYKKYLDKWEHENSCMIHKSQCTHVDELAHELEHFIKEVVLYVVVGGSI